MKLANKLSAFIIASLTIFSCNDDALNFQNNLQPNSDAISLQADTFRLETSTDILESIPSSKNATSFLLGSYTDAVFGTKKAELLAQFNCPTGVNMPSASAIIDDSKLILSFTVDTVKRKAGSSTYVVNAYRMDNGTFTQNGKYTSCIDVNNYCSKSLLLNKDTFSFANATVSMDLSSNILKKQLIDSLIAKSAMFNSNEAFSSFFKGIYFTLGDNANVMLSVSSIKMTLLYNYKNPEDNNKIVSNTLYFAASQDVRQVNVLSKSTMPSLSDSIFYASSPAGVYGSLKIPVQKLRDSLGISVSGGIAKLANGRKLNVNTAFLNVQVAGVNDTTSKVDMGFPSYLALVKKSQLAAFFSKTLPTDLSSEMLSAYSLSSNSYSFSIPSYLMKELKNTASIVDELVIVPVSVEMDSSSNILSVTHDKSFSGVTLRSGKNSKPLKLDVVVSGF